MTLLGYSPNFINTHRKSIEVFSFAQVKTGTYTRFPRIFSIFTPCIRVRLFLQYTQTKISGGGLPTF